MQNYHYVTLSHHLCVCNRHTMCVTTGDEWMESNAYNSRMRKMSEDSSSAGRLVRSGSKEQDKSGGKDRGGKGMGGGGFQK